MAHTRSFVRTMAQATGIAVLLALLPAVTTTVVAPAAAASFPDLKIQVVSARASGSVHAGDPLPSTAKYTWLITADDVGDPSQAIADCQASSPTYPDTCNWPSIRQTPGAIPVVAQGTQADLGPDHRPRRSPRGQEVPHLRAGSRIHVGRQALHHASER